MPTVEFQRTLDDMVAFTLFLRRRTGADRYLKWYGVVTVIGFTAYAVWSYLTFGSPSAVSYVVSGVIFALVWCCRAGWLVGFGSGLLVPTGGLKGALAGW